VEFSQWLYILVLLLAIWNGIARELRNGLSGYLLQTAFIAILYGVAATRYQDVGMWTAFAGLVVLRGIVIPAILTKGLPHGIIHDRLGGFLLTPTYLILVYLFVASVSFGLVSTTNSPWAIPLGAGLATLLVGLLSVALSHDAGKQVLGLMTADNGIDLCVVTILPRITALGDYVMFLDITLTVFLLVILMLRLRNEQSLSIKDYHQLRG